MVKEGFLRRRVEMRESKGEDLRDAVVVVVNPSRGKFWITASFIVSVRFCLGEVICWTCVTDLF